MKMSLLLASAALAAAAATPGLALQASAPATASVSPAAGAIVYDPAGGEVGRVDSVSGTTAVIDTGTNKAAIPFASFGTGAKGLVLGMTKAQLDEAAGKATADAKAQFAAKLVAGTPVVGANGAPVGTIEANDGTLVTLAMTGGKVKLPVTAFGPSAAGGVQIGMTAEELSAAAKAAGATPAPAADATPNEDKTTNVATNPPAPNR